MDSSKSARLIMDAHEYTQRGENVFVMKSSVDSRSKTGYIESRTGLSVRCMDVDKDVDIVLQVHGLLTNHEIACIFVDESQFLTKSQVLQLRIIVEKYDIPVMCYGLKSDFRGELFTGSKALFEHANRFEEVKTICREENCRGKAMYNVRYKDGKPTFIGDQVKVGDTVAEENQEYYVVKCARHYLDDCVNFAKENEN